MRMVQRHTHNTTSIIGAILVMTLALLAMPRATAAAQAPTASFQGTKWIWLPEIRPEPEKPPLPYPCACRF